MMEPSGQVQAGGLLSWLGGGVSRSGKKGVGDLGKELDQIRRELFELYTSVGLVAGGAGLPLGQLPLLQALLKSLRSTLEVVPEPAADREHELRAEVARLSAALIKSRTQFDDLVNALEVLGIPARSLRNPSRASREPQQSVPPFMDPALPPPDPTFSASPEKSELSPKNSIQSGLSRSESFTLKKDKSYITRSDSYIPPIWGGKPSEAYASQSLIVKEDDSKPSLQASLETPVHSYVPWDGWGRPSPNARTRTIIHGGSVFFTANEKEREQMALSVVSDDTSKDVDPQVDSDTASEKSEKSDVSDKALRVMSPTSAGRGFGSPARESSSPSPKRKVEVSPAPTPGEAFWRILWGLEPSPPKPPPLPKKKEERVDERAISTRAVYDMFFGEDPCVDMTVPDRPTIIPSASRLAAASAPASPPRPPLPPPSMNPPAEAFALNSAPAHISNQAPSGRRQHPAGLPLPRQKSAQGVAGANGPLPPRSPRPAVPAANKSLNMARSVRKLPRSPLASVSSIGSSGASSEDPDVTNENYVQDGDAAFPDSPQQSVTSERRSARFGAGAYGDSTVDTDAALPMMGDGRQAGVVESPNSVLPGHGPGWQGGEGPAYVSEVVSCESPPHSRSGSSEWSDGPDDDVATPAVNATAVADLSTLSLNGVLEPPGYEELFGDGPTTPATKSSPGTSANVGAVPEAGRAPVKGTGSPFPPRIGGAKAGKVETVNGRVGLMDGKEKHLTPDILVPVPLD